MNARNLLVAALAATATAAGARSPVPLQPIGLPFAPDSPQPVAPGHPLYHALTLDPIAAMPAKVGKFLVPITNVDEMNTAMRETLERANMLAPAGTPAKARLRVQWVKLDAPAKISFSSRATASLRYALVRQGSGETLFEREITTVSTSRGGEASDRLQGNARLALLANIASAIVCLDKGAKQQAPADCALQPKAVYRARRPATVTTITVPHR